MSATLANESFSSIKSLEGTIEDLNLAIAVLGKEKTICGYAPSTFVGSNTLLFTLVKVKGGAPATTTNNLGVILPVGATVTKVVVTNNGVTIAGTGNISVGTGALNSAPSISMMTATGVAVFAGTGAVVVAPSTAPVFTNPGVGLSTVSFVVSANQYLNVSLDVSATAGDLKVCVTYE
jgi:hypothetical protein